jgi:hypothetical protein
MRSGAPVIYQLKWFLHTPGKARLIIGREEPVGEAAQILLVHIPSV